MLSVHGGGWTVQEGTGRASPHTAPAPCVLETQRSAAVAAGTGVRPSRAASRLRGRARRVQPKAKGQDGFGKRRTGQDPAQTTVPGRWCSHKDGREVSRVEGTAEKSTLTYGH